MFKIIMNKVTFKDGVLEKETKEVDSDFFKNYMSIENLRFFKSFGKCFRSQKQRTHLGCVYTRFYTECYNNYSDTRFSFVRVGE